MQKEEVNSLYEVVDGYIPESDLKSKNRRKAWKYGYDKENDVVVISKTGRVGEVYRINGVYIALPSAPSKLKRTPGSSERHEIP